ncbi:SGNH/GDSL hydrolase family protein [Planotetraspora thailandica]|uniref:SGNH/GDSL hydrolase family protein n=1 Tax=Planotetraspora thailandica TaxID=487172 RepID=UPI00194FF460|nr:SGNH/GDSL hydrolase family protein [Planotetraspora thailandica]
MRRRRNQKGSSIAARCAVVVMAVAGLALSPHAAAAVDQKNPKPTGQPLHEVGTWGASADRTPVTMTEQTVRNIVHTSVGGSGLRISLSNAFGTQPVVFGGAYVGLQQTGAAVVPGTNRQLTFGGSTSVTVPAGAQVLSDPLPGTYAPQQTLAVSLYVRGASGTVTGHNLATQTSYVSSEGDHSAEEDGAAFTTTISRWYWVDSVVVSAPKTVGTVVALGDSITDGLRSTPGANRRWPDVLAGRLLDGPRPKQMGVLNEGISGNRVLADGAGVSVQARFDRDVLAKPGVRTVILMEGINDINGGQATSGDQLIAAYRQLIARAHAEGTCILGATMTPFKGLGSYTDQKEAIRTAANEFIRHSREFDGVVDFDKVTRDPADPQRFLPLYDSGDHLHPSDAGYAAMGDAVNLKALECKR